MKFMDLPSLGLPAGSLTIWRAHAPDLSGSPWATDPRRASHGQEARITDALETTGEGDPSPSWLGCTFDLPAELDDNAFATALRHWTDRHETLRSHLTRCKPNTALQRKTLPPGVVGIHHSKVGGFTDGRILARYLETLFDREASPLNWPAYVCATICHATATTVCLAADHSVTDGDSTLRIPHEIHALYTTALALLSDKPPPAPLPPVASYLDFAEAERTAAAVLTTEHKSIVRWQQFVTDAGGRLPTFPLPVGKASNALATQPGGYAELLNASDAHAFERVCRAAGGDSFSGLLACLAKVGHEITGSNAFRTMIPFHTRMDSSRFSLGWYVGMGPMAFRLSATDSFIEAVRAAVAGLDGVKDLAQIPLPRVAELLGYPLRDPFMVSYSDFRRTPGARHWNAWRAAVLRSRSTDPEEVCLWAGRGRDGLVVSYRHPATDLAGIAVPRYVARAKQLLVSVARTTCWPSAPATGEHGP